MQVKIFYKPDSEQARHVDEFVRDFGKQYPDLKLNLVNPDDAAGGHEAELYDVMQYPTILALSNDGATLQRWDNGMMPLMSEVAYFANS